MYANHFRALLAFAPPTGTSTGPQPNSLTTMILPLVLMAVIFFFVAIRPQQQRAKQQAKLLSALKAGDKVVTSSGIIGTVTSVKDKSVALRSGDAKFEVTKASVTDIIPDDAGPTAS
jgi:preprotein translocase subunit YajC